MRSFGICTSHQHYYGDQIDDDKMDAKCGKNGRRAYRTLVRNLQERVQWQDIGIDWMIKIKMDLNDVVWGEYKLD